MPALKRPLRIGTDCSGLETPVLALKQLGVDFQHVFACDVDRNVKAHIAANFDVEVWYDDCLKRDNRTTPQVDLYVAGFPCQPFSSAGKQKGFKDKRAKVFWGCARYIEEQQPRAFLLENVSKIAGVKGGLAMKRIWSRLLTLADGAYKVEKHIMKTQEHGVPQSRSRMYMVGIRRDVLSTKYQGFQWPEPLPEVSVETLLEKRKRPVRAQDLPPRTNKTAFQNVRQAILRARREGANPLRKAYFVDCDSSTSYSSVTSDKCPCITRSRGSGHWVTSRGRRMTVKEMLAFQGMDDKFNQVVSDRIMGQMIGNAMSQNVLERLLCRLLPAAGLVPTGKKLTDRYAAAARATLRKSQSKRAKTSLRVKTTKRGR